MDRDEEEISQKVNSYLLFLNILFLLHSRLATKVEPRPLVQLTAAISQL